MIIGASRSEPHTNQYYVKIAVLMYVCMYVCSNTSSTCSSRVRIRNNMFISARAVNIAAHVSEIEITSYWLD